MKKIISIILSICFLTVTLSGCAQKNNVTEENDKVSVIATIFAPYDFVREIAGDDAEITMLLPPGTESHSYEPTPQDIINIQSCDVFIYVGGESDAWVNQILESMDTSKMEIIALMDCVDIVAEDIVEGMEDDHDHDGNHADHDGNHADDDDHVDNGDEVHEDGIHEDEKHEDEIHEDEVHEDEVHEDEVHEDEVHEDEEHEGDDHDEEPEYDEHVWTSPKNAKRIVQKISDVLCEVDATHIDSYQERTTAYLAQLDELDAKFQEVVDGASRKTVVFGDRFPFRYFADVYGLEYFAAFPGCSTETEASAATIAFLIDKVKEEGIPVVFHAELSNQKLANTISEETGAKVLLLHACHNVTRDEVKGDATYIKLMNQNVENLKEALN